MDIVGNTGFIHMHHSAYEHIRSERFNAAMQTAEIGRIMEKHHLAVLVYCYNGMSIIRAERLNGTVNVSLTTATPKRERKEKKSYERITSMAGRLFILFISCFGTGATAFAVDEGDVEEEPSWFEEAIIDSVWYLFDAFITAAMKFLDWVTSEAKGEIPPGISSAMTSAIEYLSIANEWVPIAYGFGLLCAYYAIWVLAIVVKWCVRFIP